MICLLLSDNIQANHLPMSSAETYTLFLKTKIYLESALQVLSVLSIFPQRTLCSKIKWPLSKKEWQLQLRLAIKKICTGTPSSIGIVWKKSFQNFFVLPPKPLTGLIASKNSTAPLNQTQVYYTLSSSKQRTAVASQTLTEGTWIKEIFFHSKEFPY